MQNTVVIGLVRERHTNKDIAENGIAVDSGYHSSWTEEEIISAVNKRRNQYYRASAYLFEIIDYLPFWKRVPTV